MAEFVSLLVEAIYDALEEFFNALVAPSVKYTRYAFIVSLIFLGWSVVAKYLNLVSFVSWQEALTCSILLLVIVLIDSSARQEIKDNLQKVKVVTQHFSYSGEVQEEEVIEDERG